MCFLCDESQLVVICLEPIRSAAVRILHVWHTTGEVTNDPVPRRVSAELSTRDRWG